MGLLWHSKSLYFSSESTFIALLVLVSFFCFPFLVSLFRMQSHVFQRPPPQFVLVRRKFSVRWLLKKNPVLKNFFSVTFSYVRRTSYVQRRLLLILVFNYNSFPGIFSDFSAEKKQTQVFEFFTKWLHWFSLSCHQNMVDKFFFGGWAHINWDAFQCYWKI